MILWINGPFGVGKTTTAGLVAKRLEDAKIFDPEYVGYIVDANRIPEQVTEAVIAHAG
jgi:thymidylate kinase